MGWLRVWKIASAKQKRRHHADRQSGLLLPDHHPLDAIAAWLGVEADEVSTVRDGQAVPSQMYRSPLADIPVLPALPGR